MDKFEPLGARFSRPPRPPLRTVTEIAEMLSIPLMQLQHALRREGAPQPSIRANEAGHRISPGRVWYEPKTVIKWYREVVIPDDQANARRLYHREYAKNRKKS